jgi:hypothetical protein
MSVAGRDEAPEDRLLADDLRVVRRVRRGGHALGELGQVRGAADVLQLAALAEHLGQRHQVDGLALLASASIARKIRRCASR